MPVPQLGLPTNLDTTYADDAANPGRKAHQQHHDALHGLYRALSGEDSPEVEADKITVDDSGLIVVTGATVQEAIEAIDAGMLPKTGGTITGQTTIEQAAGAELHLQRTAGATPAPADDAGIIRFRAENDADAFIPYASILGEVVDATAAAEAGRIRFHAYIDGVSTEVFKMGDLGTYSGVFLSQDVLRNSDGTRLLMWGTGQPEGVVTARPGSVFLQTDATGRATMWIKENNTDATGWRRPGLPTLFTGFTLEAGDAATATQMLRATANAAATVSNVARPIVMTRPGSITGISVASSAARTGGSLTCEVYLNGAATGLSVVLDATTPQYVATTQNPEADTFSGGDRIDVRATDAAFAPATAMVEASVEVMFN